MNPILQQLLCGLGGVAFGAASLLIVWRVVDGEWFLIELLKDRWRQRRAGC